MSSLLRELEQVADSHGTVLISGESGAGKEVAARWIHEHSPRASMPLLAINCAALSTSLLESELFGHEKGAFTGADKLRKGRFDEIFFVDLPGPRARADILRIHLKMRDFAVKSFDLAQLTQATDGFSGAEIEQAIVSAHYAASASAEALATGHILAECARTRPLSIVMS